MVCQNFGRHKMSQNNRFQHLFRKICVYSSIFTLSFQCDIRAESCVTWSESRDKIQNKKNEKMEKSKQILHNEKGS